MIRGLYVILETNPAQRLDPFQFALACILGGAPIIQLREKKMPPADRAALAKKIIRLKKHHDFIFIINDDAALAREVNADGVHLGQDDLPVQAARKILGKGKIVGKSSHSLVQAKMALAEDINYLACGAIFPSPTKAGDHPFAGLETLKQVVHLSTLPVVAIGGINRHNARDVWTTGVHAIAVISALQCAKDVSKEVRFLQGLATSSLASF